MKNTALLSLSSARNAIIFLHRLLFTICASWSKAKLGNINVTGILFQTTTDFNILQNPYFAGPAQSGTSAFYLEDPDPEDLPSINIESGTLDLTFSIC